MKTVQDLKRQYPGVSPVIADYAENCILPEYALNDREHDLSHAQYVIRRSLQFAGNLPPDEPPVDLDMVFLIAVYHDLAVHVDKSQHAVRSARYLQEDSFLPGRFSPNQIDTMVQAVEDHESPQEPRNIYGRILVSANLRTDIDELLRHAFLYRKKPYTLGNLPEIESDAAAYLKQQCNGKRLYFDDPEFAAFCDEARRLCDDGAAFSLRFRTANRL